MSGFVSLTGSCCTSRETNSSYSLIDLFKSPSEKRHELTIICRYECSEVQEKRILNGNCTILISNIRRAGKPVLDQDPFQSGLIALYLCPEWGKARPNCKNSNSVYLVTMRIQYSRCSVPKYIKKL